MEMANFPMGGVLRGFMPSTYHMYAAQELVIRYWLLVNSF
jgi:hypothetical protein